MAQPARRGQGRILPSRFVQAPHQYRHHEGSMMAITASASARLLQCGGACRLNLSSERTRGRLSRGVATLEDALKRLPVMSDDRAKIQKDRGVI